MSPLDPLFTDYKKAIAEKNVDHLVGLFAEDILFFDVWDQWSMSGRDAWRSAVVEWFDFLGTDKLVLDFETLQEAVADTLISVSMFVTFTAFSPDGTKLRSKRERQTWVVSLKHEGWRIIHCHNSLPLDLQTGKHRSDDAPTAPAG